MAVWGSMYMCVCEGRRWVPPRMTCGLAAKALSRSPVTTHNAMGCSYFKALKHSATYKRCEPAQSTGHV
eukprot:1152708-Pelagomonas_calceolata.AAC.5